ncbi:neutral/alkaline non-lysosomal ceramidase N-terminal domain-containing protein [bacterium]|nr:neutral/alkaline non-lysosomal ceramidase N-terminal domain-containing protein [bacterium]
MRSVVPRIAAVLLLVAGCCAAKPPTPQTFTGPAAASSGPLAAGAAAVPIALPNGVALAGYGSAGRRQMDGSILLTGGPLFGVCVDPDPSTAAVFFKPSTGALDPLYARALVLDNGADRMAIVKVDAIGMSRKLRNEVAGVGQGLGVTDGLFAMVATHTHSGPGGVSDQAAWEIIASDCFSQAVYDAVRDAAVQALQAAVAGLQPARLGIGSTVVNGATRLRGKDYPSKPSLPDIELGLVKVTTAGATPQPIAALFNFAVHGTWYTDANLQTSADYMGAIESQVAAALPAGVVPIFTNGAEGDVTPEKPPGQTLAAAAKPVADAVVNLWTATATDPTVTLHGVFTDKTMPAVRYNPGCMPLANSSTTVCDLTPTHTPITVPLPGNWVSKTLPFQALRINQAVFIAMPGEPVTTLGLIMKQQAKDAGLAGFVLSLANDHGAYFTTPEQFDAGTYEGTATIYGRATGATVLEQSQVVVDKVK